MIPRDRRVGGYASVEFALTLPAVLLVLGFCLALLAGAGTQLRAGDAARAAARALAVGETVAEAHSLVRHLAGSAARLDVGSRDSLVVARVTVPLPLLGEWGGFHAAGEAVARPEG